MALTKETEALSKKRCIPCRGKTSPLGMSVIRKRIKELPGWIYASGAISKTFSFKNFYETISFVNAAAWIANQEDHHPEISFGYKNCRVRYATHAVKGITENDFICAAKIEALFI